MSSFALNHIPLITSRFRQSSSGGGGGAVGAAGALCKHTMPISFCFGHLLNCARSNFSQSHSSESTVNFSFHLWPNVPFISHSYFSTLATFTYYNYNVWECLVCIIFHFHFMFFYLHRCCCCCRRARELCTQAKAVLFATESVDINYGNGKWKLLCS